MSFFSKHKPSRKPVRRTCGRVVGYYPSAKDGRSVGWESQMEQKACSLFEFSPGILGYNEQPEQLEVPHPTGGFRYTPDFELTLKNQRKILVEVKPSEDIPLLLDRLRSIARLTSSLGAGFIVLTESELTERETNRNLSFLRAHLKYKLTKEDIRIGLNCLKLNKDLGGLFCELGSKITAYALIAQGHISIDYQQPLTTSLPIKPAEENSHAPFLFSYRQAPDFEE